MDRIRLDGPGILNAPPVCRFSHLKKTRIRAASSKSGDVSTGVRLASGRMRTAAARILAGVTCSHILDYCFFSATARRSSSRPPAPAFGYVDALRAALDSLEQIRPLLESPQVRSVGREQPVAAGWQASDIELAAARHDAFQSSAQTAEILRKNKHRNLAARGQPRNVYTHVRHFHPDRHV